MFASNSWKMRLVMAAAAAVAWSTGLAAAHAAGSWQWRGIVRPNGEVAVDFGLGLGREPSPTGTVTGFGMNLEISGGLGRQLELGLRTGVRMGPDGRYTLADRYGRPFDTETYGSPGTDTFANPELRLRGALVSGGAAELALEGRVYLPVENGSKFGFMLALPILLRVAIVRIDTGLFVSDVLYEPSSLVVVSIPVSVWFQASSTLWLGPLFGLRVVKIGNASYEQYPFGFGLGTMLSHAVDLRTWLWFPDISGPQPSRAFGAGVALEFRF
jgi:hypothetical protein